MADHWLRFYLVKDGLSQGLCLQLYMLLQRMNDQ